MCVSGEGRNGARLIRLIIIGVNNPMSFHLGLPNSSLPGTKVFLWMSELQC